MVGINPLEFKGASSEAIQPPSPGAVLGSLCSLTSSVLAPRLPAPQTLQWLWVNNLC